jgi:hypothetical protein
MFLRKGKTKSILDSSIDSALLAVEVYNKPRVTFRSQAYITLMIIAWTRLFHAYFNHSIGDKYYYKEKGNLKRYELVDDEKKAWELSECIRQYRKLDEAVKVNLEFFIKLRNKIEHRHINAREVDVTIFGECQSLLFNYENTLVKLFGNSYSINESLVYSLQFSHLRTNGQQKSGKLVLSRDTSDILEYISKFKQSVSQKIFESQEFSIKLLNIPIISNNDRNVPAIEFVKWDSLDDNEKDIYQKLHALIKNKKVFIEAVNVNRLKPKSVVKKVNQLLPATKFNNTVHALFWKAFGIRPTKDSQNPYNTIKEYCFYDEPHNDYLYTNEWVKFIVNCFQVKNVTPDLLRIAIRNKTYLNVEDFRIE